jgi:hypothetical protein
MRASLIHLTLSLALVPGAHAIAQQTGAPGRPVVVELFTSQGCSSCPPADALLTDLARTRRDVLSLAFHVTYWNNLGWRGQGGALTVEVGPGSGQGTVLLVGFDPEHSTAVGRAENGGRLLVESNVVRSVEAVGQWSGAPLRVQQPAPAGEQFAAILEAPDGRIIGAARFGGPVS